MAQNKNINSSNISVVLQGPTANINIKKNLFQIRKVLPNAEIIISTWKSKKKFTFKNVKFLYLKEPKAMIDINGVPLNYNKMIYSTYCGINKATKKYILKLRTDCSLVNKNFLNISKYDNNIKKKFFSEKVNITNFFTRNPIKLPFLFFLSDLVMFGKKKDLKIIWYHKRYMKKKDFFYNKKNFSNIFNNYNGYSLLKKNPEQALFINLKKKFGFKNEIKNPCYIDKNLLYESETLLINNFQLFESKLSGIIFPRKFDENYKAKSLIYSKKDFDKIKSIYQSSFRAYLRFLAIILNKYIICFFKIDFYLSNLSIFLRNFLKILQKILYRYYERS